MEVPLYIAIWLIQLFIAIYILSVMILYVAKLFASNRYIRRLCILTA